MKNIYIDSDFKCHVVNDGTMTEIQTDFFDDKCDAFIEGYRFIPKNDIWVREDGEIFEGGMISPWKNFDELEIIQYEYERQLLKEYKEALAEADLAILELQYQSLMEE